MAGSPDVYVVQTAESRSSPFDKLRVRMTVLTIRGVAKIYPALWRG
jgi:hypothetical protein